MPATSGSTSLTIITNGALTGGARGIYAANYTGPLTIVTNGNVTGGTSSGIDVSNVNFAAGTSVSVTTGPGTTVSGTDGISVFNGGTGATTITANGNVIGTGLQGIYARNSATATDLTVTTGAGTSVSGYSFGIRAQNAGTGALTITANGNVTAGATGFGIDAYNTFAGTTLTLTTGAGTTVSGGNYGIVAQNNGTGALTITANGNVTGTNGNGISAFNFGTALSVTTAAGTTVSGGTNGIYAQNGGTGALTVTANGNVTGGSGNAIYAHNYGTALSVTTGAGTTVSGLRGIEALNDGTGALTVTTNGNVTGTSGAGIFATNSGTDLSVTTGAGTTVSGGGSGISAQNNGTGALTITANGNVTAGGYGIHAGNSATATTLTVTTGAGTTVSSGDYGIAAGNSGTGALTITANGNVSGAHGGIGALNFGAAALTVTTAAGTRVSGGINGINAQTYGAGALTVTANGNVSGGTGDGILAVSAGAPLTVTVAGTSTVASTGAAAIETKGGAATVTVAGTLNGGAGGAVKFDQTGGFANRLELVTGAVINGNVFGGNGTDTLGLSGTASGSFNVGQLVSFEAGAKTGSGSWTLTGTNAGIGAFSVGAGTLTVNGSLSNAAFTVTGGTLGGTGTVGNTLVTGGSFAPGSGTPGSSMTVSGSLALQSGALYLVQINSAASTFSNVTGTAALAGTVQVTAPPGSFRFNSPYTILTSAGLGGTQFNGLITPAGTTGSLIYSGNNALLNLASGLGQIAGLNVTQHNVATALDSVFNASGNTGGLGAIFAGNIPQNLTQVSGETATGSQQTTFNAMNQFMGVLTDPFIDGRGDGVSAGGTAATSYASTQKTGTSRDAFAMFTKAAPAVSFEQRWSVWAAGFGGSQTTDGNAALGSNTTTSRIAGTAVGADYRISPYTIAGFALAGGGTSFGVNGFGSGRSDLFQAGAFVRHNVGPVYLTAALAYGWQDVTTDRTVTVAGIDHLRAEFNANAWSGRAEGGYRFVSPWIGGIGITPYAAGQFTTFDLPAYAEQVVSGANTFALAYGAKSVTDSRSELGIRTDKSFAMPDGIFTLRGRLAWAHDYDPNRSIGATFQTLPGASFVVNGAAQAADSALVTASVEKKWLNGWSAAATFEGEFSDVTRSYAGKGVVRYQW